MPDKFSVLLSAPVDRFRATDITPHLQNGGSLENAAAMADELSLFICNSAGSPYA